MSSTVISAPGSTDVPQRKPGDSAISASRSVMMRVADQIVERAVEGAATIEQRLAAADHPRQFVRKRRARLGDRRRHLRVRRDGVGEQRNELVAKAGDLHAAHIEIEPRQEFAVAARRDQQGLADPHGFGQRVVRMRGQDHVDAGDAASPACGRSRNRCATAARRAARPRCAPWRRWRARRPRGCRTTMSASSSADWRSAYRRRLRRARRS